VERSDILVKLNKACADLQGVLEEKTFSWVSAVVSETHALKLDRIYELTCYFVLVAAVGGKVKLKCMLGAGKHGYRMPYGPGKKESFAFFRFDHQGHVYDICCGTGVVSIDGTDEHPDVSLQYMGRRPVASSAPGGAIGFWDAKFHLKGGMMGKDDLAQMVMWSELFDVPRPQAGDILEQLFPPEFGVGAVVSNAVSTPDYGALLLRQGFSVLCGFDGALAGQTLRPTRAEHLAHPGAASGTGKATA
jgi:hypothetical protein